MPKSPPLATLDMVLRTPEALASLSPASPPLVTESLRGYYEVTTRSLRGVLRGTLQLYVIFAMCSPGACCWHP